MKTSIKIGNAGGFWGDDLKALRRQIEGDIALDYISSDYLAEITMSILRKQQQKNPQTGYVTDFVDQIVDVADLLKTKKIRMIANAGGINPLACAREIIRRLDGKTILKIAVVEGDNLIDSMSEFYPAKADFKNMESDKDFQTIKDRIQSANAYLGLPPLLKALESGADLIIAGRVTDTSITMAPAVFEFGWKLNDWDKLASALIAGHIIECGAQGSGGNFTDWQKVEKWGNFGYPIAEIFPDGHFYITKHPHSGGSITINSVKEQLLYEMGDPENYISPDVIADFKTIQLEQAGHDRVKVFGIKGKPSTHFLKVSMAYADGFKASGSVIIGGCEVLEKARVFENIFWERLGIDFVKKSTEYIGYNATMKDIPTEIIPNEILLQFSVFDFDKNKINEFSKSIAPIILSGPPGVAVTGGRPQIREVMTYWPALIPKTLVPVSVKILTDSGEIAEISEILSVTGFEEDMPKTKGQIQISSDNNFSLEYSFGKDIKSVKLKDICLARSGDKGDMANIGLIARSPEIYQFIKEKITADFVKSVFSESCKGIVVRYELDNLQSLNFLVEESLDGGGTKSLMIDAQGKIFAQNLLKQTISVPEKLLNI